MKYYYYIALLRTPSHATEIKYVTAIDNASRTWQSEWGCKAWAFGSRKTAQSILEGMLINGIPAALVQMPYFVEVWNPERSYDHEED